MRFGVKVVQGQGLRYEVEEVDLQLRGLSVHEAFSKLIGALADLSEIFKESSVASAIPAELRAQATDTLLLWFGILQPVPSLEAAFFIAMRSIDANEPAFARALLYSALHLFQDALIPGDPADLHNIGVAADTLRDPELAMQAYRLGVQRFPTSIDLLRNLAGQLSQQHQFDEAEQIYQQAFTRNPQHYLTLAGYINHLTLWSGEDISVRDRLLERLQQSGDELLKLGERRPENVAVFASDVADAYVKLGNIEEAKRWYEWAIEAAPHDDRVLISYTNFLDEELNDVRKAFGLALQALQTVNPSHSRASSITLIACDLASKQDSDEARELVFSTIKRKGNQQLIQLAATRLSISER